MRRARSAFRRRRGGGGPVYGPAASGRGPGSRVVRFYRTFRSFHGGHLKVFHYFRHVEAADGFDPTVWFSPGSVWDGSNPWSDLGLREIERPPAPDIRFVAGRDWTHVPPAQRDEPPVPVINLIQHVRHAEAGHELASFLSYRAIRICVGPEVASAIEATGRVQGPVITIPNGIDIPVLPDGEDGPREVDLLIVANKRPDLGREVLASAGAGTAATLRTELVDEMIPRERFLAAMRRARVTLFLPNPTEGFYLPALEGMAQRTVVVCPDAIGNRSFCLPGETAFLPAYELGPIIDATRAALGLAGPERASYLAAGTRMASDHDLSTERRRFHEVLSDLDALWG